MQTVPSLILFCSHAGPRMLSHIHFKYHKRQILGFDRKLKQTQVHYQQATQNKPASKIPTKALQRALGMSTQKGQQNMSTPSEVRAI